MNDKIPFAKATFLINLVGRTIGGPSTVDENWSRLSIRARTIPPVGSVLCTGTDDPHFVVEHVIAHTGGLTTCIGRLDPTAAELCGRCTNHGDLGGPSPRWTAIDIPLNRSK